MRLKIPLLAAAVLGMAGMHTNHAAAADPFTGELRLFGNNFCPRSWAPAQGQILQISSNTALFSLLGTTYGGDGRTTFGLPDLSLRSPVGVGNGPGLSFYSWGARVGSSEITMTLLSMPSHSHSLTASGNPVDTHDGVADFFGSFGGFPAYAATTGAGQMASSVISSTGAATPFTIDQPQMVMNWCIALQGVYPSRS
ncbi:MAG: tail fiber protein [Pseudomonadota bacterium]